MTTLIDIPTILLHNYIYINKGHDYNSSNNENNQGLRIRSINKSNTSYIREKD